MFVEPPFPERSVDAGFVEPPLTVAFAELITIVDSPISKLYGEVERIYNTMTWLFPMSTNNASLSV